MTPREEPQANINPEKLFASAGLPAAVNLKYYDWLEACPQEHEQDIPAFLHFLQRYFNKQSKDVLPEHEALKNDHRWAIWQLIRNPRGSWQRSSEGRSILPSVLTADQIDFGKLFAMFVAAEGIAFAEHKPIPEALTHDETVVVAKFHDNPEPQLVMLAIGVAYGKPLRFMMADGRGFMHDGTVVGVENTDLNNMWDIVVDNGGRSIKVRLQIPGKRAADQFRSEL